MGEVEVMEPFLHKTREPQATAHSDQRQALMKELSEISDDDALMAQIARLVRLSRELLSRGYTGQVTLHLSCGRINSVRQEEWMDWRGEGRTKEPCPK